jgi:uncharacterized protein
LKQTNNLKILFFLAHPAHYHLFKNSIRDLKRSGHEIVTIIKSKDVLERLLIEDNIPYRNLQIKEKKSRSKYLVMLNSIAGLLLRDIRLFKIVFYNRPSLMIGTEWSIVHVGKLLKIPSILVNEDDTTATPENKYFYPFATTLLLPSCCDQGLWLDKRVTYNSYHELAYLHPSVFIPDENVVRNFNSTLSPYAIIRLVKLTASHDINMNGLNESLLDQIIAKVSKKMTVFICSEKPLAERYIQYQLKLNPVEIHHALYYAKLFVGDSQTMAAEAGVLGTPFIRYNDFVGKIGYLEELENKYNLGFGFPIKKYREMLDKIDKILSGEPELEWKEKRDRMLNEKIRLSDFLTWFIGNYPSSVKVMKEDPDYQLKFG